MNKLNKLFHLLPLVIILFLYSCDDDQPAPIAEAKYSNGVLVVNKGNYMQGNGSLDFYNIEEKSLSRNIFQTENNEIVGGIIEDVAFYKGKGYIISNVADKIIITDADSLREIATIQDRSLTTPRYFTASGDKGYVSVWGPYESDYSLQNSKVIVIDLNSNSILDSIPVPPGPEGLLAIEDKVFVANSTTDSLSVIDTKTDAVIKKIKTQSGPQQIVADSDGNPWVIFSSGYIIQFNSDTYAEETVIELSGDSPSGKVQLVGNTLYFHTSRWNDDYSKTFNAIYKIDLSAAGTSVEPVVEKENMSTFSVDPTNGNIYAGIAAGADPGTIVVFDEDGTEQENFAAGVFPHEIIVK